MTRAVRPARCTRCSADTRQLVHDMCGACYSKARRAGEFLRILTHIDTSWMDSAACAEVGGDLWFPEAGGSARDAKKICRSCEVTAQCLAAALVVPPEPFGVWGAMTTRERNRLTRRRAPRDAA